MTRLWLAPAEAAPAEPLNEANASTAAAQANGHLAFGFANI
jgi:hypothetical protein